MDGAIALIFGLVAVLYASVGHGGGSGYLAVMALLNFAPPQMKPTALLLNVVVATVATVRFSQAGFFSWRLFWPLAIASVPLAYLGGLISVPGQFYRALVGIALLWAAFHLLVRLRHDLAETEVAPPPRPIALGVGAAIGLLSGLTGVGGGIFLSPLALLARWTTLQQASAVAAPFILLNSLSGLLGHLQKGGSLPPAIPLWLGAVLIGGSLGAQLGVQKDKKILLRRLLALVLAIAGSKLILT